MIDYTLMGGIVLFLLFILIYKAKYLPNGNSGFFDVENSKAMRGFWCLIVIFVHVPITYQNRIQDMIGSFAYIGVTFFFMTSAYGLSLGYKKNPDSIKSFWRNRLPKLIIPNWIVNIIFVIIFFFAFKNRILISNLLNVNAWVRWLLLCYFSFWIGHCITKKTRFSNIITSVLVFCFSIIMYYLKTVHIFDSTTWCPESIGFIWGLILAANFDKIKLFFEKKWNVKVIISLLIALVLGILYLKYKYIIFWGDYILKIILGYSILIFILLLNSKIKIGNKILSFLGEISFEVYLIHGAVFELISRLFIHMKSGIFILLSIIITILIASIVHCILKLILRRIAFKR